MKPAAPKPRSNLPPLPRWAQPALQGLAFWIGHRRALYSDHPLANTKVAKIKLLLNPTEVPSRNLLDAIRTLEKPGTLKQRMRRSKWLIIWGDIVLKEEWDRVRAELTGAGRPTLTRRVRPARTFFAAAIRAARSK